MKRLILAAILTMIASIGGSGCARIKVYRTSTATRTQTPQTESVNALAFGFLTMKHPTVLSQVCPQGWQELATDVSGMQKFYRIVTLGFYTPWTQEVSCAEIEAIKERDDF